MMYFVVVLSFLLGLCAPTLLKFLRGSFKGNVLTFEKTRGVVLAEYAKAIEYINSEIKRAKEQGIGSLELNKGHNPTLGKLHLKMIVKYYRSKGWPKERFYLISDDKYIKIIPERFSISESELFETLPEVQVFGKLPKDEETKGLLSLTVAEGEQI